MHVTLLLLLLLLLLLPQHTTQTWFCCSAVCAHAWQVFGYTTACMSCHSPLLHLTPAQECPHTPSQGLVTAQQGDGAS
jgi:hypothetical protein